MTQPFDQIDRSSTTFLEILLKMPERGWQGPDIPVLCGFSSEANCPEFWWPVGLIARCFLRARPGDPWFEAAGGSAHQWCTKTNHSG
jgi:hypothetical protein